MILLTFLGKPSQQGGYSEATYKLRDRTHKTRFFPAAVPQLVDGISEVRVFLTEGAREGWKELQLELLPLGIVVKGISIPDGKSPEELWAIFQRIVAEIPRGAELIFDTTLGFRSLSLFSALGVALLKATRDVNVRGVLYGAFEAKAADGTVPVFDLSLMISLLDWVSAVDRFRYHMDGKPLQELLNKIQRDAYTQGAVKPPTRLRAIGDQIGSLTDALLLGRVREVLQELPKLQAKLSDQNLAIESEK